LYDDDDDDFHYGGIPHLKSDSNEIPFFVCVER